MSVSMKTAAVSSERKGFVYCYLCTHTVEAQVVWQGKSARAKSGQKCSRCGSSLDAGYVVRLEQAA